MNILAIIQFGGGKCNHFTDHSDQEKSLNDLHACSYCIGSDTVDSSFSFHVFQCVLVLLGPFLLPLIGVFTTAAKGS